MSVSFPGRRSPLVVRPANKKEGLRTLYGRSHMASSVPNTADGSNRWCRIDLRHSQPACAGSQNDVIARSTRYDARSAVDLIKTRTQPRALADAVSVTGSEVLI